MTNILPRQMKIGNYITILVISFAVSCSKNENAYVKGQAIENDTGKPIPGVIVSLVEGYKDSNGGHQTRIIGTSISDQNGFYQINYHRKLFTMYYMFWRPNQSNYLPIYDERMVEHKKSAITIGLIPVAYIKIRLKKNSSSNNYVTISPTSPEDYSLPIIQLNSPFDTILQPVCRVYAGYESMMRWTLWPKDSSVVDKFILQRGDTLNYTISFN
ncbi:MAG: hypothetical protein V4506_09690 [Bacteroidota bacterium]